MVFRSGVQTTLIGIETRPRRLTSLDFALTFERTILFGSLVAKTPWNPSHDEQTYQIDIIAARRGSRRFVCAMEKTSRTRRRWHIRPC